MIRHFLSEKLLQRGEGTIKFLVRLSHGSPNYHDNGASDNSEAKPGQDSVVSLS